MRPLQRFLLVALIFLAQAWAGAHAVEHAVEKAGGPASHVCELCLAAHDLGSALPSLALALPLPAGQVAVDVPASHGRSAFPAPPAGQRGPPSA